MLTKKLFFEAYDFILVSKLDTSNAATAHAQQQFQEHVRPLALSLYARRCDWRLAIAISDMIPKLSWMVLECVVYRIIIYDITKFQKVFHRN